MQSVDLKSPADMERIVILSILIALLAIHLFVVHKLAFLGFYYLPILLAGYFCGKRTALLLSILAVLLIALYTAVEPGKMSPELPRLQEQLADIGRREQAVNLPAGSRPEDKIKERIAREKFNLHFSLVAWGGFLVLSAIASSLLYEQKQKKVDSLRQAYVGVLEILTKYLELADRYSAGRSVKVSELASAMSRRLNLDEEATENIRIAALLHDLGHKEVSALILGKSAELGKESDAKVTSFSVNGKEILRSVSSVLGGVVPIVNAYYEYFVGKGSERTSEPVTIAAEIIAVARAYDDIVTGTPTRKAKPSSEALEQIKASAGRGFDAEVIEALEKTIQAGDVNILSGEPPHES